MSFNTVQESEHDGEPILLFEFLSEDGRSWRYTDQIEAITKDSNSYQPANVSLDSISQNLGEGSVAINVVIESSSAIAFEFKPFLPPRPITLRVWEAHRGDDDYKVIFMGECISAAYDKEGFATIPCAPTITKAKRTIPWCMCSATCNWAVYSDGCGVDKEDFEHEGEITAIDGASISADAFDSVPDGYFTAGFVVRTLTGEMRWIVAHEGDEITLAFPFLGMEVGEDVVAYAGCDGLESTCSTKFNGGLGPLPTFSGFPDLPSRNPFTDNVFGTGGAVVRQFTSDLRERMRERLFGG